MTISRKQTTGVIMHSPIRRLSAAHFSWSKRILVEEQTKNQGPPTDQNVVMGTQKVLL